MSARRLLFAAGLSVMAALVAVAGARAACEFDGFGTITNATDPTCRDARFELTENATGADRIALGYPPPIPVDSMTPVAGFRRYASLHAQHQALFLGTANVNASVVGQTLAGREIWAYRIGDDDAVTPDGLPEPAVLLNGTIHAREWQSPEAVTEVLEQLVEKSTDGGVGQYLSEHLNVIIVPVLNIDGFIQTQAYPTSVAATAQQPRDGRMRRKNLRTPGGGAIVDDDLATSLDQFDGVDLNRNSVHGFGLNNGSSPNPISLVYRGTASASEPESRALLAAAALGPADRLRFFVDAHSFTRVFFVPTTSKARRNALTQGLADRIRAVSNFRYSISSDPAGAQIGTTADYFALEHEIPSWTLEIEPRAGGQDYGGTGVSHSGFVLPDAQVPRMRDEIAQMLLLGYYRQAGPPAVRAVQITRAGDNMTMYRADWITNAATNTRALVVSADAILAPNESYRLWVAFDKPMRTTLDGVTAANYPGQNPPALGTISLDAGAEPNALQVALAGGMGNWLGESGGAPDGFARYRFDAFAVDFVMPALSAPVTLALSLDVQDLSMQALDANPATPVDWRDGHWDGYEDAFAAAGDSGGADCQLLVRAAPTGAGAPTAAAAACKATFVAPPPAPAQTPIVTPQRSGGGTLSLFALLVLTAALFGRATILRNTA